MRLYLIYSYKIWFKPTFFNQCISHFATYISNISNKMRPSFVNIKSQKTFLITISAQILAFSMAIFLFFFVFSRSIFAIECLDITISYYFHINFALLFSIFISLLSSLNFSSSFLFVIFIEISPLSRIYAMQSLVSMIFSSTKLV